ncbi:MAG: zinc ribbon domain-containing protein [Minisyncoccia bacterium]
MNTFCNKCGKKLEQDNKFCKFCGIKVGNLENVSDVINKKHNNGNWLKGFLTIFIFFIIASVIGSFNGNDQDISLIKTDKNTDNSEQAGNLYRNTKYKFRIKFPEGWEIEPGDGPNVIQKATKGNNSINIGVREIPAEYNTETATIKDAMSLVEFRDSFSGNEFQEKFPGSILLDYGETKIDNKMTYWVKYSMPYSALDINIEGIMLQYQLLYKNVAYFITAGSSSNEFDAMEAELKKSIATFVIEDY